jgi:tRNA (guanine37-N1)-methyltransferase
MSIGKGWTSLVLSISLIAACPELADHALTYGVTGRAREQRLWRWQGFGLHDFAADPRKSIDTRPAAGGPGMVLMSDPLDAALAAARAWHAAPTTVVLLSPDGLPLLQSQIRKLSGAKNLTFVAGRYEGIDQRWIDGNVDLIVSIGDYVLSGGEIAAAAVVDSCVRLLPGALGDDQSAIQESFSDGRLDWPQFALTSAGHHALPKALATGDHADAMRWRRRQSLMRTWMRRPDLLCRVTLTLEERIIIDEIAL